MFKKIELDNYESFRHIEIDLTESEKNPLPYAFIYGENGSGKSNLIGSLSFLRNSIRTIKKNKFMDDFAISEADMKAPNLSAKGSNPRDQEMLAPLDGMFKDLYGNAIEFMKKLNQLPLDITDLAEGVRTIGSDTGVSTSYHFVLGGHDGNYVMKFGADNKLVHEKLSFVVGSRTRDIFEICAFEKNDRPQSNHLVDQKFSPQLFLNQEYSKAIDDLIKKYWGKHSLMAILNEEYSANNTGYMDESVGTGIADVIRFFNSIIVSCKYDVYKETRGISERILTRLDNGNINVSEKSKLMRYEGALNSFFTRIYSDIKKAYYKIETHDEIIEYTLFFSKMIGGKKREISISNESTGTQRLLTLFPVFLECARGKTVFYDELDSGIHDLLIREIMSELVKEFKGQFIATTHNTSLLEVMDPKSVFVIQVDPKGEKRILPINRIERTQKNHNNRNRYLNGVFSGIPITGEIDFSEIVQHADDELGEMR